MTVERIQPKVTRRAEKTPAPWRRLHSVNWRLAGSAMVVCVALLLGWHVVYGKNGLIVWQQKKIEDQQLQQEINQLREENNKLAQRVERLRVADPDEITHEAREKLHYARPDEIIVTLPQAQKQ